MEQHNHSAPVIPNDSFFGNLLKIYVPRQQCMYHEQGLILLHLVSDIMIATAYYSIPLALVYLARRRQDLAFNWMFLLFALFIVLCGTTHVFNVLAITTPVYRVDGIVKLATALVSIGTAVLLFRLLPSALALPSIAEIRGRKEELEKIVEMRTSELVAANDALADAKVKAESANRAKTDFLASMSHEIRTPMSAIIGLTEILRRDDVSPEKRKLMMDTMATSADQLMGLIENLLDIARIESEHMRLQREPFRISTVVTEVMQINSVAATRKNIALAHEARGDINMEVMGDALRLKQVLMNVVANAVKFTDQGHVKITTDFITDGDFAHIRFDVSDTGIGIAADKLDRIFNIFTQADRSITRKYGGTGLGLSIAKMLIEMMGGRISVESHLGEGTTFRIALSLPVKGSSVAVPAIAGETRLTPHGARHVLIVDDYEPNILVASSILDAVGFTYEVARNGGEALNRLAHREFDLVLMDVQMPLMDGCTATSLFRARETGGRKRTPVIGVTAYATAADREKSLQAGMDDYLVKPFTSEKLMQLISKHLIERAPAAE
jgi:signal transduction histidine kinase/ActR/RegA family two-component response regulator